MIPSAAMTASARQAVHDFWNAASCGEVYASGRNAKERFENHRTTRYRLEPYIAAFAGFPDGRDRDVLEVGVGMGADHVEWAKSAPRSLTGVDLTPRAVEFTRERLAVYDLSSTVEVADAEHLPFADHSFDLVYSWGVLHHSPDTAQAFREVRRVLRVGGEARIAIYHQRSIVGFLLWLRYAAARGRLRMRLEEVYARYLESPGTKAYTVAEGRVLADGFRDIDVRVQLSFGDLLEGAVGQRHRSAMLSLAKALWPRWLIKRAFANCGGYLLIRAKRP